MDGSGPLGRAERGELRVALAARRRSALLQQAAAPRDGRPRRVRLLAFVVALAGFTAAAVLILQGRLHPSELLHRSAPPGRWEVARLARSPAATAARSRASNSPRELERMLANSRHEVAQLKARVESVGAGDPVPGGSRGGPADGAVVTGGGNATAAGRRNPCVASAVNEPPLLYVGVLTRATSREQRDALRRTWFTQGAGEWTARFFLGRPKGSAQLAQQLEEEAARECDIEFVREEDDYYSIAYKSLEVLERGSLQERAAYVLKTDDDSFVYVAQLLRMLRGAPREGFFWGYSIGVYEPHRDKKSPFYMTQEEWPDGEAAMQVLSGAGYVLSADLAAFVARESHKPTARILRLEDVTVAALLRGAGGYNGTPRHDNRVRHLGRCTDDVLILHYQKPAALLRLHAALQNTGFGYPTCVGCKAAVGHCLQRKHTSCRIDEIRFSRPGSKTRADGC